MITVSKALLAGIGTALALAVGIPNAQAKTVALAVSITIDKVSPTEPGMKVGMVHTACVFYDDTKIDPKTQRVVAIHETHAGGIPKHLNPQQMPMTNAWLDLSGKQIKYHFAAAPTTAFPFPYFVLFDETTMRMTIYRQADGEVLLAGNYTVDPQQHTGAAVEAAVSSSDPVVPPWETTPAGMNRGGPPNGSPKTGGAGGPGVPAGPGGPGGGGRTESTCPSDG